MHSSNIYLLNQPNFYSETIKHVCVWLLKQMHVFQRERMNRRSHPFGIGFDAKRGRGETKPNSDLQGDQKPRQLSRKNSIYYIN